MEDKTFFLDDHSTFKEVFGLVSIRLLVRLTEDSLATLWEPAVWITTSVWLTIESVALFSLVRKSKNRFLWAIALTGVLMNWAALLANGFKMPVFGLKRGEKVHGIHKRGVPSDRLKFLCDIYRGPADSVFSLGDVFITIGEVIVTVKAIQEELRRLLKRRW